MTGAVEFLRQADPESRLLPQGRLAGPMPWVVAIMILLTTLACAAGIALRESAATLARVSANRLTVQIIEPRADLRGENVAAIVARVAPMPGVASVAVVPRAQLLEQLRPWLGSDAGNQDIAVPALIDVDLAVTGPSAVQAGAAIRATVAGVTAKARVEAHARYLEPVAGLVGTIGAIAFVIVALMAVATGFVVVLAARGAHATHRETIAVMHMLGATDQQVMRLFQRRITRDVSFGAALGFVVAVGLVLLVGRLSALLAGDLMHSIALPLWAWPILVLLCVGFVLLARLAARLTLTGALKRAL